MSDIVCMAIVVAVFAIPGLLCSILGCDPSFQPVCINLQLERGVCSHYKYFSETCSTCTSYSESCDSNNQCSSHCTSYVYYPCYSSMAFFTLPDYHNKTCHINVDYQQPDLSVTIADTEAKYPLGTEEDFFIRKTDDLCVMTYEAISTAQAGLALSAIAFVLILWFVYLKRNTLFSKPISPMQSAPPPPLVASVSPAPLEPAFSEPSYNEIEMSGVRYDSTSYPAVAAVTTIPMMPVKEISVENNADDIGYFSFVSENAQLSQSYPISNNDQQFLIDSNSGIPISNAMVYPIITSPPNSISYTESIACQTNTINEIA